MSILLQLATSRCPTVCRDINIDSEEMSTLSLSGYDMTLPDCGDRSMMHCIICKGKTADTALLNGAYGLQRTTPFPWHLTWCPFGSIAFLRSRFDAFRSKLGLETFRELLNLQPAKGWSPLCRAASLNLVDIMENCLSMGAKVDFEG